MQRWLGHRGEEVLGQWRKEGVLGQDQLVVLAVVQAEKEQRQYGKGQLVEEQLLAEGAELLERFVPVQESVEVVESQAYCAVNKDL